jgi:hypothetical protein
MSIGRLRHAQTASGLGACHRNTPAALYVKPSSGIFNTVPHALQCTASLSWRCSPHVGPMPADEQPRGKIREDHGAKQHIERFGDVVGRKKRRRNDEKDGDDIERQQWHSEIGRPAS